MAADPTGDEVDQSMVGRPRDAELTERIVRAAQQELAANGVEQFSVRGVARRAGVSRKSVSIRWPAADDLLIEALGIARRVELTPTGDVRADLLRLGRMLVEGLGSEALDVQLRVAADRDQHPQALAELQRLALVPAHETIRSVLRAGQARGVVRAGDVSWLAHAFIGALFMRTIQNPGRRAATRHDLGRLVDQLTTWAAP